MLNFPINDVIPKIKEVLTNKSKLIIEAPAGAGKSTIVPISLLNESWLKNKKIIVLEPRRVAARAVATQMAKLLGQEVGQSVGYQVKMESCYSKDTKILVVTEGILTRKLQSDQALEDIACVIFDEFHERSIHTDLSLALALQSQEMLREDLKIVLMSATLNSQKLSELLDDVQVVKSDGRMFDVKEIYLDENIRHPNKDEITKVLYDITMKSLHEDDGDILVFLAGVKEINNLKKLLDEKVDDDILVLPLHSNLSKKEQDRAIYKNEKRKVILSTNLAQTSLTIEGIKVVIDSGLEKLSRFDYSNGLDHLELSFISEDSSIQRQGRAGRLSSGKCYKLWHKKRLLEKEIKPEILRVDLSSFLLDVSLWGCENLDELTLLNMPNEEVINQTKNLLESLDMLEEGIITEFGKDAISLGLHPRFSFMLLKANELGYAKEASYIASLLSEKDIFSNEYESKEFYDRFEAVFENKFNSRFINIFRAKQVIKQSEYFYKKLKSIKTINKKDKFDKNMIAVLLLFAYPDRLAKRREINENRYKLSNAKGAVLHVNDPLFNSEYLVVANLIVKQKDSFINLASKIDFLLINKYFSNHIEKREIINYDKVNKKLDIKEALYLLDLELKSQATQKLSNEKMTSLLIQLIKIEGLELLTWNKKAKDLINRVSFVNSQSKMIKLPDFTKEGLLNSLDIWCEPYLKDVNSLKKLESLDTYSMLLSTIPWDKQQELEVLAPSTVKVPSGSNIKIDYSNIETPILSVKIQEVFGMENTPKVLNGQISLQVHLLSPALRPIQITYDLKSFWENSYDEVRKELRGKYKKHYWPDNPFEAVATNKTKKNMKKY